MTGIYLEGKRGGGGGGDRERAREENMNERDPRAFILLIVGTSGI